MLDMPIFPKKTLIALSAIVVFGTTYSVVYNTYLDTSNPLLTHLPHPLHKSHYFASKSNILNVLFIKKLWGWTSAAFLALYLTSPPRLQTRERLYKFLTETALWLLFTGWFFGPSLLERLTYSTGGECLVHLPSGALVTVPSELCYTKSTVSATTHPELFAASLAPPAADWRQVPRVRRGHDVSGHMFLLTMAVLFLAEQVSHSVRLHAAGGAQEMSAVHKWVVLGNVGVIALGYLACYTTSVYFHTPFEKFTGFCESRVCLAACEANGFYHLVLGLAGYAVTRTPLFRSVLPPHPRQS